MRLLEKIIGRMIDINYHILKHEHEIIPVDYKASFIKMRMEYKNKDIFEKIANSASLRNVLIHEYEEIDNRKVYNSINLALTQVPRYLKAVVDIFEY